MSTEKPASEFPFLCWYVSNGEGDGDGVFIDAEGVYGYAGAVAWARDLYDFEATRAELTRTRLPAEAIFKLDAGSPEFARVAEIFPAAHR